MQNEKAEEVTNRLYEAALNRQKKIKEDDVIRKEALQLKDCTFVPKVKKSKYLKQKARISRFGEKDMAFLQTQSAAALQNKLKKAQELQQSRPQLISQERKVIRPVKYANKDDHVNGNQNGDEKSQKPSGVGESPHKDNGIPQEQSGKKNNPNPDQQTTKGSLVNNRQQSVNLRLSTDKIRLQKELMATGATPKAINQNPILLDDELRKQEDQFYNNLYQSGQVK